MSLKERQLINYIGGSMSAEVLINLILEEFEKLSEEEIDKYFNEKGINIEQKRKNYLKILNETIEEYETKNEIYEYVSVN